MITSKSINLYQHVSASNEPRVFKHWHASSIAECPRAHYFKRLGIPSLRAPGAGMMLRWKAGHLIEEAIRPHVEAVWPKVTSNVRLTDKKLDVTGEYDNLSDDEELIEVKSVSVYAFKDSHGTLGLKEQIGNHANGNRMWGIREDAYLHHRMQNHVYALLLPNVKRISYIYIALDGRIVTYQEDLDPELTQEVTDRLEQLNRSWRARTPPPCLCKSTSHALYEPVMQWCDYREGDDCCSLDLIKEKENKNE